MFKDMAAKNKIHFFVLEWVWIRIEVDVLHFFLNRLGENSPAPLDIIAIELINTNSGMPERIVAAAQIRDVLGRIDSFGEISIAPGDQVFLRDAESQAIDHCALNSIVRSLARHEILTLL